MKWLVLSLCITGCAAQEGPTSSKVTLDGETWTATALSFDQWSPVDVRVVLAHEVDRAGCGWLGYDQIELSLLIGDRSTPHNIEPLDVETPLTGYVIYTDDDLNYIKARTGVVVPGLTRWEYSEVEGHNVVVQLDGEFDVVLEDGRALSGAFSATPCGR